MKTKYIIREVKSNTYFLGANPYPVFGAMDDGIIYFDNLQEAENRLNEEFELFGEGKFEGMVIEINKVYTF